MNFFTIGIYRSEKHINSFVQENESLVILIMSMSDNRKKANISTEKKNSDILLALYDRKLQHLNTKAIKQFVNPTIVEKKYILTVRCQAGSNFRKRKLRACGVSNFMLLFSFI